MNEFKSWQSYWNFANSVRRCYRFIRTDEDNGFLREVVRTSESRIENLPMGYPLWRAQVGHRWEDVYEGNVFIEKIPAPYHPERMKPSPKHATEGRINPKGIPVLYLSTQRDTAMSEVRPGLRSLVSCAQFRTKRNLRIIDCYRYHDKELIFYLDEPDAPKKEKAVWRQIDQAFSRPVTSSENTTDYVPTQVIAELFKDEGYDGIAYKSAFGDDGYNVALFNLDDAEYVSCCVFSAQRIDILFNQESAASLLDADGIKTLSVEVESPPESKTGTVPTG